MKERLAQVHHYWFGDFESTADIIRQKGKLWFGKDEQVDRYIREQFSDLIELGSDRRIPSDGLSPQLRLSVILLLDQFTRNIYRNDPRSFASDPLALKLAQELMTQAGGLLRPIEKVFLYLPLEHSEELDDQKKSVALFRHLHETAELSVKETFASFYDYAVRHHDIIDRFGRFPHRNKILGRASTVEEIDFLSQPGSSF